jgi:hypothetical protein
LRQVCSYSPFFELAQIPSLFSIIFLNPPKNSRPQPGIPMEDSY